MRITLKLLAVLIILVVSTLVNASKFDPSLKYTKIPPDKVLGLWKIYNGIDRRGSYIEFKKDGVLVDGAIAKQYTIDNDKITVQWNDKDTSYEYWYDEKLRHLLLKNTDGLGNWHSFEKAVSIPNYYEISKAQNTKFTIFKWMEILIQSFSILAIVFFIFKEVGISNYLSIPVILLYLLSMLTYFTSMNFSHLGISSSIYTIEDFERNRIEIAGWFAYASIGLGVVLLLFRELRFWVWFLVVLLLTNSIGLAFLINTVSNSSVSVVHNGNLGTEVTPDSILYYVYSLILLNILIAIPRSFELAWAYGGRGLVPKFIYTPIKWVLSKYSVVAGILVLAYTLYLVSSYNYQVTELNRSYTFISGLFLSLMLSWDKLILLTPFSASIKEKIEEHF